MDKIMPKLKTYPLKCYICGRFIGKDGYPDVYYDDWNGGWEDGGSMCGECGRKKGYLPKALDEEQNNDHQ
jgi:hypothetical protein